MQLSCYLFCRTRLRSRIRLTKTSTIIRDCLSKSSDVLLHRGPRSDTGSKSAFEYHRRRSLSADQKLQTVTADVDLLQFQNTFRRIILSHPLEGKRQTYSLL